MEGLATEHKDVALLIVQAHLDEIWLLDRWREEIVTTIQTYIGRTNLMLPGGRI